LSALRPPQAELQQACLDILAGEKIQSILVDVAPGGGKSKLPVILASLLLPSVAEKVLWIVPRNALKTQGEAEFLDPRFPTPKRLRAVRGNESDPARGCDGYITTFQALGMSPDSHLSFVMTHKTVLFLDEIHHVADDSSWADALAPMIDAAVLVVYASGTLSRHDGQRIHGLEYRNGLVDLRPRDGVKVIRYGRGQALKDGNILPVNLLTIDGAAEWVAKNGERRKVDSLYGSGDDRSDTLFSMLRTEYAKHLLRACLVHWDEHRKTYPAAKLLVVAPDIETAKEYQGYLASRILSEIATSDDGPGARRAIAEFKRGTFPALVTVGMAYEGLSVPEITHIACLTMIRSKEWLEQMAARGNRPADGKEEAWVFAPKDRSFFAAWSAIERETLTPLRNDDFELSFGSGEDDEGPAHVGGGEPGIEPLWSSAHGVDPGDLPARQPPGLAPSQVERILLDNIRAIRARVVDGARPGSQQALSVIYSKTYRSVRDVSLEQMTASELEAVWLKLRDEFKNRL